MSFQPKVVGSPDGDPIISNRIQLNPMFPGGLIERESLTNRARRTLLARELVGVLPVMAASYYMSPTQSTALTSIGQATSGQFIRFEVPQIDNFVKCDSCKLTLTIRNTSLATVYVSPSPTIFDRVDLSFSSASSDPAWSDVGQNYLGYHMSVLSFMDRDEARKVLNEEGFVRGTNGSEDLQVITSPVANTLVTSTYSPLYPDGAIAPGASKDISLYVLGSPITAKGFVLAMLSGSQRCTLNFTFKSGGQWLSTAGSIEVSKAVLSLEGKNTTPSLYREIVNDLRTPGMGLTIPYLRPVNQAFPSAFTANNKNSHVLTQFVGPFSFLHFFIGRSDPATSNAPQTDVSSAEYFQGILPQIATGDFAAGTSTLTAGSLGELQIIDNITILKDGFSTVNTPDLSSEQMNTLAFSCTDNMSYLIPSYPARYFYPFSTDLYDDVIKGNTFKNGIVRLVANATIQYTPRNNVLNSTFYVFGGKCATLEYSAEGGIRVIP